MPKRDDLKTILVIGSGPIVIGQACEFDYAGTQACLALKALGYRVVLINSNPATIMTDPQTADQIYLEPITWQAVEKIIQIEKPDALLTTMGGQTAINCTMDLIQNKILEQYQVALIGAGREVLEKAEDRALFQQAMSRIGLKSPRSEIAVTLEQACAIAEKIGFPVIIRPSFTLGGSGSGIAVDRADLLEKCQAGFKRSPTHSLLIEESIIGWKEYELEVVRDKNDNGIVVCSIENLDPMGVHTGDSITVAPTQTLTDREYQEMRCAAIAVLREVGVETGGANVQFAVNPHNGDLRVIEMNPRVSRSSALASKATGFPIARVAAQLAVGLTLDELQNSLTADRLPASFEPTLDYVVVKIPRFHFEKFKGASNELTTQMHSVGEVMAIGSYFLAAFQKALCGLEINVAGLVSKGLADKANVDWKQKLSRPTPKRIFFVGDAFRAGLSLEIIFEYTRIDPWFLAQIKRLIEIEKIIQAQSLDHITQSEWLFYKKQGFSDRYLSVLLQVSPAQIRAKRKSLGIVPVYKRIDTCSAEFPSETAYLYSTYETVCEAKPTDRQKIIILGSGPNRIGQGIEFDYGCVHAAQAVQAAGFEAIMVNCNPETVSTDHTISDKLYFEPLTLEHVLDIIELEKPFGVLIQFGGQTPLKLAQGLAAHGVRILGTSVDDIHRAEERACFQNMIRDLGLKQPNSQAVQTVEAGLVALKQIGLPVIVRPSYVLGGQGMAVIKTHTQFVAYLEQALSASEQSSVLVEAFLENATEVDVDVVCDGQDIWVAGILEHIEKAGIHSGDSTCVIPPFSLSTALQDEIEKQALKLAGALNVVGLMNIQFAIQGDDVFILEVNPRASRTVPFVAKAIEKPVVKIATRCILGTTLKEQGYLKRIQPKEFCIKFPVFVFDKFKGSCATLGPEMKSTGEVMSQGLTVEQACAKLATVDLPVKI